MRKILLASFLIFLFLEALPQDKKLIVGYYPSWRVYERDGFVHPSKIQYEKYDILLHFSFGVGPEGNIVSLDSLADSLLVGNWVRGSYNHNKMVDNAHKKGTKVLATVGGWNVSENFPVIAASKEKTANFTHSCAQLIRKYDFDGIDIDWEFPADPEFNGTPEDTKNFTVMMQALRDTLYAIDNGLLLTGAFGAAPYHLDAVEWSKMKDIVDYVFLMTYNFNGTWNEMASYDSTTYAPVKGYKGSMDESFKLITEKYGVPKEKVLIGISWMANSLWFPNGGSGLYAGGHNQQKDTVNFSASKGNPSYYELLHSKDNFLERWDSVAQMPYLISKDGKSFVSYENPSSVKIKAKYALENEAGGVFIWDVPGDYIQKYEGSFILAGTPLVDVLVSVLRGSKPKSRYRPED